MGEIEENNARYARNKLHITHNIYSKTCLKGPLKNKTKNWFSRPIIALMQVKSIAE